MHSSSRRRRFRTDAHRVAPKSAQRDRRSRAPRVASALAESPRGRTRPAVSRLCPVARQRLDGGVNAPHDRSRGRASSDDAETGAGEGRDVSGSRRARRNCGIDWIRFDGWRLRSGGGLHRGGNERGGDALPPIALAHVEARDRPHRHIVHAREAPRAVEPWHRIARRDLTPAHGQVADEASRPGGGPDARPGGSRPCSPHPAAWYRHCQSADTCTSSRRTRHSCRTGPRARATAPA